MSVCDYDPPSVYRTVRAKARKAYRCSECRRQIVVGERYVRIFGVWDGDAATFIQCEECETALQWTKNNIPCLCFYHGMMLSGCGNSIIEARERAPEETKGLLFGYFRKLSAIRRAGGSPPRSTLYFAYD